MTDLWGRGMLSSWVRLLLGPHVGVMGQKASVLAEQMAGAIRAVSAAEIVMSSIAALQGPGCRYWSALHDLALFRKCVSGSTTMRGELAGCGAESAPAVSGNPHFAVPIACWQRCKKGGDRKGLLAARPIIESGKGKSLAASSLAQDEEQRHRGGPLALRGGWR
jgi:hypothetical protein